MRIIDEQEFLALSRVRYDRTTSVEIERVCRDVLAAVEREGDRAVLEFTRQWDGISLEVESLEVTREQQDQLAAAVPADQRSALELAARRIEAFHSEQKTGSWMVADQGLITGQFVQPLGRVGLYVPGGRASYPSSVLMTGIPAQVAGVQEIIACTPAGDGGDVAPLTALACRLAGVSRLFRVGGAQAVAAMALGTGSIPAVDFICGPGNEYVTMCKRLVRGRVGTDLDAGPSEIAVLADESGVPAWVAWDLLAQAEHDMDARVVLIATRASLVEAVQRLVIVQSHDSPRRDIIAAALEHAVAVVVASLERGVELVNAWAPEHLALHVRDPWDVVTAVRNAGAVMIGGRTPVALADYTAGTNHVLPTGGTARFSSALGTDQFCRRTNLVCWTGPEAEAAADAAAVLAGAEGLYAHERSITARLEAGADDGVEE